MFEQRIQIDDAPFLQEEIQSCCSNIREYNSPYFDSSFLATARALLFRRVGDDEVVIYHYKQRAFSFADAVIDFTRMDGDSKLLLCVLRQTIEDADVTALEENGFRKIEKVSQFFQKSFYVSCFVNDDLKESIVAIENATVAKYHYLQTAMLNFFPWYYAPGSEITDKEKAFIRTLGQKDYHIYLSAMRALAPEDSEIRDNQIRFLFSGFENKYDEKLLSKYESEAANARTRIDQLYESLRAKNNELRETMTYIASLSDKINSSERGDELMNYLLRNQKIVSATGDDGYYYFVVRSTLSDWDEDEAENSIRNRNGSIYGRIPESDRPDWQILFRKIFIDRTVKIRSCAKFSFNTDGYAEAISGTSYPMSCDNCLPNPHIHWHYCTGTFQDSITQCASNFDFVGVVEVCVASTQNLNFSDYTVLRNLSGDMFGGRDKEFLEMPDGSIVSPMTAIKILKEDQQNG